MSEYIITDEQLERLGGLAERINDIGFTLELGRICRDLRETVRCHDCKKCNIGWCLHFRNIVKPDGFCAWGERRERESIEVWNKWSADDITCWEESGE